jgi:hypothetical protein
VGTLKGLGRIYQQTFIHTYSKVAFAKLYDRKTPVTAADLLNDRVVPFFEEHEIALSRVLTDRGTEYCGTDAHEYELYLAVEDIDHTRTKAKSPQTNGICERFHKTVLNEFYRVTFRKKFYRYARGATVGSGFVAEAVQRGAATPRKMVLRENSHADFHRQCSASEREDDRGVSGAMTKADNEGSSNDCQITS